MNNNSPQKILHISQSEGGVRTYIEYILKFDKVNEHFLIAPYEILEAKENIKIDLKVQLSLWRDFKFLWKILLKTKKLKPNIIHCHSGKGGIYGRIVGFLLRMPVVFTPHAFGYLRFIGMKKKAIINIERCLSYLPHYLLPSSPSEEDRGINVIGYKKKNVLSGYYNSIEIGQQPAKIKTDNNLIKFLFVGRFTYQKDPLFLIESMKRIRESGLNFKLTMIGSGWYSELDEVVKTTISDYKLDEYIEIIPWMERENLLKEYQKNDIFLLSSRYESFGYVTCEAMSYSLPIISRNIDGSKDLITNGFNGLLVNSIEEMTKKILILSEDSDLRYEIGMRAREHVDEFYNIKKNIEKLQNIYKKFD